MRVRFTRPAQRDLEKIYSHISKESSQAASRVVTRLIELARWIGDHPQKGRETDEPNVRVIIVPKLHYLIFYSIVGDEIQITHIRHTARSRPPGWKR
jgi:addiction module RelE/StbE family toxin